MYTKSFKLAIDGPASSGKSTISKELSNHLGWNYIDTGAMFRALTLFLLENNIPCHKEKTLYQALAKINISYYDNKIFLNQQDVSSKIKSFDVEKNVSIVATLPLVRDKLLKLQQDICTQTPFLIMDGRDIGTVVIPGANLKIFLTANVTERALRKQEETKRKFQVVPMQDIIEQLKERDHQDYHRLLAPLTRASDAILLDTTALSITEVLDKITLLIQKRIEKEKENVF